MFFYASTNQKNEVTLWGINMFRNENRSLPWPVMTPFGELLWLYLLWSMGPRAMDSGLSTEWGMTVNRRSMNKYSHWNISSSDPPRSAILQWKLSSSPNTFVYPNCLHDGLLLYLFTQILSYPINRFTSYRLNENKVSGQALINSVYVLAI